MHLLKQNAPSRRQDRLMVNADAQYSQVRSDKAVKTVMKILSAAEHKPTLSTIEGYAVLVVAIIPQKGKVSPTWLCTMKLTNFIGTIMPCYCCKLKQAPQKTSKVSPSKASESCQLRMYMQIFSTISS